MARDKDIEKFKRDAREFGKSAAGHVPYLGKAMGIHDTYQKGRRLTKSTPKALDAVKRRIKSNIRRRYRRFL